MESTLTQICDCSFEHYLYFILIITVREILFNLVEYESFLLSLFNFQILKLKIVWRYFGVVIMYSSKMFFFLLRLIKEQKIYNILYIYMREYTNKLRMGYS